MITKMAFIVLLLFYFYYVSGSTSPLNAAELWPAELPPPPLRQKATQNTPPPPSFPLACHFIPPKFVPLRITRRGARTMSRGYSAANFFCPVSLVNNSRRYCFGKVAGFTRPAIFTCSRTSFCFRPFCFRRGRE